MYFTVEVLRFKQYTLAHTTFHIRHSASSCASTSVFRSNRVHNVPRHLMQAALKLLGHLRRNHHAIRLLLRRAFNNVQI
jgi:hypothetical protein